MLVTLILRYYAYVRSQYVYIAKSFSISNAYSETFTCVTCFALLTNLCRLLSACAFTLSGRNFGIATSLFRKTQEFEQISTWYSLALKDSFGD